MESFKAQVQEQVSRGIARRDEAYVKKVFSIFADESGSIPKSKIGPALEEVGLQTSENGDAFEAQFLDMDKNKDSFIDEDEFLMAAKRPTVVDSWAKSIPWWQAIADAMPCSEGSDPLRVVASLSVQEIDIIFEVVSGAMKRVFLEQVEILQDSYAALDMKLLQSNIDSQANKFKTFKASCGIVKDYHKGLKARVGKLRYPPSDASSQR